MPWSRKWAVMPTRLSGKYLIKQSVWFFAAVASAPID